MFKYNCAIHKNKITDDFLLNMSNIKKLDLKCKKCSKHCSTFPITDISISRLVNLTELDCSNSPEVSDLSINLLTKLKKLTCINCPLISKNVKHRILNYKKIKHLFPNDIMEIIILYTGDCKIINTLYVYYPNLLKKEASTNDKCNASM